MRSFASSFAKAPSFAKASDDKPEDKHAQDDKFAFFEILAKLVN